jgi:hypothetical protein
MYIGSDNGYDYFWREETQEIIEDNGTGQTCVGYARTLDQANQWFYTGEDCPSKSTECEASYLMCE